MSLPLLASTHVPQRAIWGSSLAAESAQICDRQDDEMRTSLRAHLAALRPTEVILPSQGVSSGTRKVLLACLRSPRINSLPVGTGFWSAAKTLEELKEAAYFIGELQSQNLCGFQTAIEQSKMGRNCFANTPCPVLSK